MDIATRKKQILSAVIESYVATGEPIGSKALERMDGFNVSSATIRNDLADLTNNGFLHQPHTSAGRVPTQKGYRYYIDNLMKVKPLNEKVQGYIYHRLRSAGDGPEHILSTASNLISELTNMAAIATTPAGEGARVHRIKFVQTGRFTSMVVLITSAGMVKSRLFRCDFDITPEMLNVFDRALNEKFAGRPLDTINQPFIQSFAASFGELALLMPDMLMAVMEACKEASGINVYLSGTTKLLYLSEVDLISSRNVLEFLSDSKNTEKLVENVPDGTSIYIGRENLPIQLKQNSFAVTRYQIHNEYAGAIGVITPINTDYGKILSILEFTAKTVGELISEIVSISNGKG